MIVPKTVCLPYPALVYPVPFCPCLTCPISLCLTLLALPCLTLSHLALPCPALTCLDRHVSHLAGALSL